MDINTLRERTYVPYSESPSVALVHSEQGRWFPGIRIENIAYPLSISSVQNALFSCLSEGDRPTVVYTENSERTLNSFWESEFQVKIRPLDQLNQEITLVDPLLSKEINPTQKLIELLDYAIVEESNFPVSALLETDRGYIPGVNIECSVWNIGLCAERVALAKALSFGATRLDKMHIHTRDGEFSSPCGACRQVILEHMPDRQIHLHHADLSESIHFSNDLLPYSFNSSAISKS